MFFAELKREIQFFVLEATGLFMLEFLGSSECWFREHWWWSSALMCHMSGLHVDCCSWCLVSHCINNNSFNISILVTFSFIVMVLVAPPYSHISPLIKAAWSASVYVCGGVVPAQPNPFMLANTEKSNSVMKACLHFSMWLQRTAGGKFCWAAFSESWRLFTANHLQLLEWPHDSCAASRSWAKEM